MCMMIKDKYIDPFTDFGFKHIFGTEKNKKFLISFLNDLLELKDKIVDLEYRNLEKLGLKVNDRKAIFDVYCRDSKDNKFIVELQRSEQRYFKDRSIYYTTFPIQEQAQRGNWDYELTRVYFIGILEFAFDDMRLEKNKKDNKYLTKAKIYDCDTKEVFYDKLTYYYLEMPKFRKTEQELSTHLDKWLFYLNNLNELTQIPKVLEKEEIFKEAFDVAEFLALDSDEQFAYQQDLKARWDNKACLDFAKDRGREEGIKEGIKEGKIEGAKNKQIEIAKNLLLAKVDVKTISVSTGLTLDEIENIK
jgi:predicted transposase/invertase (TIGR01784 family)